MRRTTASIALASLVFAACTVGSGEITSEARTVSGFDEVELQGSGEVQITVDGTESLSIEAEDNLIGELTSEVVDGRLVLGVRQAIQPTEDIVYTITMESLEGLAISGSGTITVSEFGGGLLELDVSGSGFIDVEAVDTDRIRVNIGGSGEVSVSGSTGQLSVSVSGSGRFEGTDLSATDGEISISGSGSATVDVSGSLEVDVSGSGDVEYLGDPATISIDTSGSGNVSRR